MDKSWGTEQMKVLREKYGNRCAECGMTEAESEKRLGRVLEFHHIKPTGVSGMGRGSSTRASDIRNHPDSYQLLCRIHHMKKHPERFKA